MYKIARWPVTRVTRFKTIDRSFARRRNVFKQIGTRDRFETLSFPFEIVRSTVSRRFVPRR